MQPLGSAGGRRLATAIWAIAHKMHVVQIGNLRHDLHLSIFPSLVSDRRSEPIINLSQNVPVAYWCFSNCICLAIADRRSEQHAFCVFKQLYMIMFIIWL